MQTSADELERLAETHDLITLTEEEERMIHAFRLFKDKKHKPGAIFTWQTTPEIAGGELPSRIITPQQNRQEFERIAGGLRR
jgi:hypothetical protein